MLSQRCLSLSHERPAKLLCAIVTLGISALEQIGRKQLKHGRCKRCTPQQNCRLRCKPGITARILFGQTGMVVEWRMCRS